VVTNAGNVVVVVVVDGRTAGTTCGVGSGACALLRPKATESTKTKAIMPVDTLWLNNEIICTAFLIGKEHPTYHALGFGMPFVRVGNQTWLGLGIVAP
jgi:hypothetical protein